MEVKNLQARIAQLETENSALRQEVKDLLNGRYFPEHENGIHACNGQVYGIDENGFLYDIEPLQAFRPSEY